MGMQSYMATVFMGEREISGAFKSGDFRSSLNFADTCAWPKASIDTKSCSIIAATSTL